MSQVAMVIVTWWTCALLAFGAVRARLYERCELAFDLQRLGVDKENIPTWVCIAYHESRLDTAAHNPGSGDHGLLQISELYWCGPDKECDASCSAFRDDDITDDVECALKIYEEHTRFQGDGFLAWVVYPLFCKHVTKKYLADCGSYQKNHTYKTLEEPRARSKYDFDSSRRRIDGLNPSYLTINSIIRSNERISPPGNFLNFKVDNIDDLKLPVFTLRTTTTSLRYDYTTSVATTSTSSETSTPISHEYKPKVTTPVLSDTGSYRDHSFSSIVAPAKSIVYSQKLNNSEKETGYFKFKTTTTTTSKSSSIFPTQIPHGTSSPIIQITTSTLRTSKQNHSLYQGTTTSRPKSVTFHNIIKPTMTPSSYSHRTSPLPSYAQTAVSKPASHLWNQVTHSTPQPPISTLATTTRPTPAYISTRPQTKLVTSFGPKEKLQSSKSEGKTTQSIFDLYLNPTKRSNVVKFQIPSRESRYKLKIFSGGTTVAPL